MSRRTSNQQKETKEEKRKRIQANLEAQERLKTFTLPVLGVVALVIFVLIVIFSQVPGSTKIAPPPPPKSQ